MIQSNIYRDSYREKYSSSSKRDRKWMQKSQEEPFSWHLHVNLMAFMHMGEAK